MDRWPAVVFSVEDQPTLADAVFLAESSARRHRAAEARSWPTDAAIDRLRAAAVRVLYQINDAVEERLVVEWADCVADCRVNRLVSSQNVHVRVNGPDMGAVRRVFESITAVFPVLRSVDENSIGVHFWTEGRHGPAVAARQLTAPRWAEVARNYPAATRRALAPVMQDLEATAAAGRLLLWHGPPGTGKTFALRALARTHATVMSVDFILEPETFLGGGAGLLSEMLDSGAAEGARAWRLLVLEDADELIAADARLRAGQGLSRLLNLADGLFGQGFQVLILLTTNEPMTAFHPAIARPGRCGSLVRFDRFDRDEAAAWLSGAQTVSRMTGSLTLAELYALKAGHTPSASARTVGFRLPQTPRIGEGATIAASPEVAP